MEGETRPLIVKFADRRGPMQKIRHGFIYTHPAPPKGSAFVKRDLRGVERPEEGGGGAVLHGVVVGLVAMG